MRANNQLPVEQRKLAVRLINQFMSADEVNAARGDSDVFTLEYGEHKLTFALKGDQIQLGEWIFGAMESGVYKIVKKYTGQTSEEHPLYFGSMDSVAHTLVTTMPAAELDKAITNNSMNLAVTKVQMETRGGSTVNSFAGISL